MLFFFFGPVCDISIVSLDGDKETKLRGGENVRDPDGTLMKREV